ncbi:hypothetical protein DYB36_006032 [Aphanomyces astaci]|uniref:RING-type domain-containing protein n=1 Tax=Aphanomyces astaci TaxID=112090 RepID=A0A397AXG0_APHAT|nr:hypothetical protein DYB36_006032 [Aphanomyces astaci]
MLRDNRSFLVPEDVSGDSYFGVVALGSKEFLLRVVNVRPQPSTDVMSLARAGLETDAELSELLRPYVAVVTRRLQKSLSIDSFLKELHDLLEGIVRGPSHAFVEPPKLSYYEALLQDVATIGWDRVLEVNTDDHGHWNGLHVQLVDSHGRKHAVSFRMDASYPSSPPTCGVDVPEPMPPLQWSPLKPPSLQHAIDQVFHLFLFFSFIYSNNNKQVQAHLETFQDFWDVLDDIDKKCCVLEPDRPTRGCKRRRLAVRPSVSIQFDVPDPVLPRALVDVVWFGNDAAVTPLRETLYANLSKWKPADKLRRNLERVLGVRFPSPRTAAKDEFALECGICYAHRLDDRIPDRVCDSANCARSFHGSCLLEWLQAIPTSRKSFGTVFGSCPYCREPISAKGL